MAGDKGAPDGLRKMNAEEFVRRLANRGADTHYALLLGAGCSVGSGIPAAGSLVKEHWLPRLQRLKGMESETFQRWLKREFPDYDTETPSLSYGPVMEAVFPSRAEKQKEVERICRGHDPSFGCCVLAKLIEREGQAFNVVLTTNFDDLMADALYLFTASRPLVISHSSLAPYMLAEPTKPLIAKLHGDYQLQPLNTRVELSRLNESVDGRVRRLLQQRGLIVLGYGGNDDSVMDALRRLPDDALGPGVWWVSRDGPNAVVSEWLVGRSGCWVEAPDFDQLMLLVREEFDLPHPDISRWEKVQTAYFDALGRLQTQVAKLEPSSPSAAALKRASDEAVAQATSWWAFDLAARRFVDTEPGRAAEVYESGLEQLPDSHQLMVNYGSFLTRQGRDLDRAQELLSEAVELEPEDSTVLSAYATFLTRTRRDDDEAQRLYERAIELEPDDTTTLANFGSFLTEARGDHRRAEEMFARATERGAEDAAVLANYARTSISAGDLAQGRTLVERALSLPDREPIVNLELWFYTYANGPEGSRPEALAKLKALLTNGVRSPGWDFSGSVKRAEEVAHPEAAWLKPLSDVAAARAELNSLEAWPAWEAS